MKQQFLRHYLYLGVSFFPMPDYNCEPDAIIRSGDHTLASFVRSTQLNADEKTVNSFGEEWTKFSQFTDEEIRIAGDQYFDIVPQIALGKEKFVLDIGCGSGRWSKYISEKVGTVEAIDPGAAVHAAINLTKSCGNVRVTQAGFGRIPFEKNTFDLVFSLGVVHHLPDTEGAIREAASMVKPGGYLLLYIYYSLDNRGVLYKLLFQVSALFRKLIAILPGWLKKPICDLIAVFVYLPFVLLARFFRFCSPQGKFWTKLPLSYYADKQWKIIRNDALDRFGTPLEKRFSKKQIAMMLEAAGMRNLVFSAFPPYWHVIAQK